MSVKNNRKLYDAASNGNEALVSKYLKHGASVDSKHVGGWTALHGAVFGGHNGVVTSLLDAGYHLEARTDAGSTPLSLAAWVGRLDTAKYLLVRGANINTQNNANMTPLHRASFEGYNRVVSHLLLCGADPEIRNNEGKTAEEEAKSRDTRAAFNAFKHNETVLNTKDVLFEKALRECNYELAAVLAYNCQNTDILSKFIEIQDKEKVKDTFFLDFFDRSVSVNPPNAKIILDYLNENADSFDGNNTLHHGALNKSVNILKISKESGVNIEKKNFDGNTPLHIAAESDNYKVVKYLLANGASSTHFMKNSKDQIPLAMAKNNKHIFKAILIDLIEYALKSPKFTSKEFQNQLGSGKNLFCLKRDFDGKKTLLEFLNDQEMFKEREELIQLLIQIDNFRYRGEDEKKRSKRRIIKVLRAGIKPSRGLKESIDSVEGKYSWEWPKISVKCTLSVIRNIILGWSLFGFDVYSDWNFYKSLREIFN